MKQLLKKTAKACAVALLLFSSIYSFTLSPVLAANNPETISKDEMGKVKIICSYSSGIKPLKGDKFTISYTLTGLTEVQELEIDGMAASKEEIEIQIPYGVFNVVDVSYTGTNEEMEALGYGTDLIFQSVAGEDPDLFRVAVGSEAGRELETEGNGILAKVNGYIINSFDDLPMDGTEESSKETESDKDSYDTKEDGQEAKRDDEEQGETIYYNEQGEAQEEKPSPIKKVIPLTIMAGIVAIIIFIMHKRGKI